MRNLVLLTLLLGSFGISAETTVPKPNPVETLLEPNDPRPGLIAYFDALNKGDEIAAAECWLDDLERDPDNYAKDVIAAFIKGAIAESAVFRAILETAPELYEKIKAAGKVWPTGKQIGDAHFTVYRRLAIVKWGSGEDEGFPMVLDNSNPGHRRWKISKHQWFETNHSSVGDSVILSGISAQVSQRVAMDVRGGKIKTIEELERAYEKHFAVTMKKLEKEDKKKEKNP